MPKSQEKIAAPPDILAAFHAPNNQPDPKIEPIPVIVSAKVPSLRFIFFIFHTSRIVAMSFCEPRSCCVHL
ncbi:hypothetical protein PTB13_25160, partial [Bacillus sp. MHSD17]|nr:hypothetical protein [Bacillus sp. MHSD17]